MATQPNADLRDRDWEILLRSIENGKCVLLLGPNLDVTTPDGDRVNLCNEFATSLLGELGQGAPEQGNFSLITQLFENEFSRDDLEIELADFYRNHVTKTKAVDDPAFAALSALPFRTYLSLRHDETLQHFLKRAGRDPKAEHYDFNGDRRDTIFADKAHDHASNWGTVAAPLIYNLLGAIEPDESRGSAVITENDLIRYLEAVVSENPKLPTDLTNYLKDKNFLFIGFGMQNFYLRILLHVLNVAKSSKSFAFETNAGDAAVIATASQVDDSVLFFRSTGFNTLKIMETDPGPFLSELRDRWDQRFPDGSYEPPDATARAKTSATAPSVFISYVSEDEEQAKELTRILTNEGLDPWLDKDGLRVGDRWDDKLADTISADVDFFVVLQSNALAARRESYVHHEVNLALKRQQMRPPNSPFIFPVLLDPDADRLEAIARENIQSMDIHDLTAATPKLAKQIRREHARWQKR